MDSKTLLKRHFESLLTTIVEGFSEIKETIQKKKTKTDFEVKSQGHLVLMTCGHRGRPSRQEEKRISRLMRKSGFIPMLEELYGITQEGVKIETPVTVVEEIKVVQKTLQSQPIEDEGNKKI